MPTQFAALLRGVSPTNLKMTDLARSLEAAGLTAVKTVLASGNAVFSATERDEEALTKSIEAALGKTVGKVFDTQVRSVDSLTRLLTTDPYGRLPDGSKRVVTFLQKAPRPAPKLPIEEDGARIIALRGREVFSAYVPSPKGPVFMTLLEKTFGKSITTRTWDTVAKIVKAAGLPN